ncbi:MAG: amidohydrolase family protein [Acidimicrobiia bacterium]
MTSKLPTGERGIYLADEEAKLSFKVFDADHHFYPPDDAQTRHLEKKFFGRAFLPGESAIVEGDEDDAPAEAHKTADEILLDQKQVDAQTWRTVGEHPVPEGGHGGIDFSDIPAMETNIPIPGAMLNKLNPMRDLDKLSRAELVARYNEMRPAFEKKEPRLALMDIQGVQAAVIHPLGGGGESAFARNDVEAGYAVARAFNRWIEEDWAYNYLDRIYVPAAIPLADVDMAVAELERVLALGAKFVNLVPGPAWYGRSPFDPYFDPFWARINESETRIAIHLGAGYIRHGAEWGEDPKAAYSQYNGFQWFSYWSDRPIMETIAAMIFHGLFQRFPKVKVLIAEFGTIWLPYTLRKLDHAAMLGRRPKFAPKLAGRPSSIFKEHCVIAPYPEENVSRVMEVTGTDCLVFGSDFPHAEGLPDPIQYAAMLKGLDENIIRKMMRDNLAAFLGQG